MTIHPQSTLDTYGQYELALVRLKHARKEVEELAAKLRAEYQAAENADHDPRFAHQHTTETN